MRAISVVIDTCMSLRLSCSDPVRVRTTPAMRSDRLGPASLNQRVRLMSSPVMMTLASIIFAGWTLREPGTRGKESPGVALGGEKADGGRRGRDFGSLRRVAMKDQIRIVVLLHLQLHLVFQVPIKRI